MEGQGGRGGGRGRGRGGRGRNQPENQYFSGQNFSGGRYPNNSYSGPNQPREQEQTRFDNRFQENRSTGRGRNQPENYQYSGQNWSSSGQSNSYSGNNQHYSREQDRSRFDGRFQENRQGGMGRNQPGNQQFSGQNRSSSGQFPSNPPYAGHSSREQEQPRFDRPVQENRPRVEYSPVVPPKIGSDPVTPVAEFSSLKISQGNSKAPIKRPDLGGVKNSRQVHLRANHFRVKFNPQLRIYHYDVDIVPDLKFKSKAIPKISRDDARLIMNKVISDNPADFPPVTAIAFDNQKNIFSPISLPCGKFSVLISKGEDCNPRSYSFTIKLVNELDLSKLMSYLSGKCAIPREILQAMDVVMREHLITCRIPVGRSFYSKRVDQDSDLGYGIVALKGFQQSSKATAQGLVLNVDYSVMAFKNSLPVLDFLRQHLVIRLERNSSMQPGERKQVESVLKGLKVIVNHRKTRQKYMIRGLTSLGARDLSFEIENPEDGNSKRKVSIADYYLEKYGKDIEFKSLPCLDVSKKDRVNYLPMEFCQLLEGQRFPREHLIKDSAEQLKNLSSPKPWERYSLICGIMKARDGPCKGMTTEQFQITVLEEMTTVTGRVLPPPQLKLGPGGEYSKIMPRKGDCQWNLLKSHVFDGKQIDRWAILYFRFPSRDDKPQQAIAGRFAYALSSRCNSLGMQMNGTPLFTRLCDMKVLSYTNNLYQILDEAHRYAQHQLQVLVCVMADRHPGYKNLKRISETQLGFLTQCCLEKHVKKCQDQYLANLALKLNAKIGGSNAALFDKFPRLPSNSGGGVIFIGADVNHPTCQDTSIPSIAAVVATINWPDANRYVARYQEHAHRAEEIPNLSGMVRDLLETYARFNGNLPQKIIFFRDGVSDGQFDMVLNKELPCIKEAMGGNYSPEITLIVAQKRHHTRLFPADEAQGSNTGNVLPGTVVDTTITHPSEFDFYLCSHHGLLGTSKPTHYHVLWDEIGFSSDEMQTLIYNLCYTFARATKPVSLVPPVYYADLVAYRARLYLEGLLDGQSPGSSSSSASSASSSASSDHISFPKLHTAVQNVMFFS